MSALTYRDDCYVTDDDSSYPRVSTILGWLEDGFDRVHPDILERARFRGTNLHRYFALAVGAYMGWCSPPDIVPMEGEACSSINAWIDKRKPIPVRIETPSVNVELGYGGCPDLMAWISTDSGDRILPVIDLKSGLAYKTHPLQVLAYRQLDDYQIATHGLILYITDNGIKEEWVGDRPADWAMFLSTLGWAKNRKKWKGML